MAILTRNGTTTSKTPLDSSKDKSKNTLVSKPKATTKPSITEMLVVNGLTGQGCFEVPPQEPSIITPSKVSVGAGIPIDVDENGVIIVADDHDDDDDDVEPMSDNFDLQGVDSRNAGATTGADPTVDSTDGKIVPPGNSALQDAAVGVDLTMAANGGVPASDGNLLSVGVTGDNHLTVNGDTLTDNVDDSSKSLPIPVLTGDCRDTHNHADEDDISTDVEN